MKKNGPLIDNKPFCHQGLWFTGGIEIMKRFVTYANLEEKLIWGEFVVLSFQSLEDWFCVLS